MKIPITQSSSLETVLEKVGRSLSDRFGIRVVCRGNECATNGRTIFLPSLPDDLPNGMLQVIRGYIDHEVSHLLGKSNFRILKWFRNTYGPGASLFLNMLEDLRVEEVMRQRFFGSRKNLQAAHSHLMKEAEQDTDPMPLWRQLAFGVHTRGNRLPDPPFVDSDVRQTLDMISAAVLKATRCRNTKGVARLAEEVWPIVSQLFSPPPPPATAQDADQDTAQDQSDGQASQGTVNGTAGIAGGTGQSSDQADAAGGKQGRNQFSAGGGAGAGDAADPQGDSQDCRQVASLGPGTNANQDQTDSASRRYNVQATQDDTDDGQQDNTAAADIMRALADAIVDMVNDYSHASNSYRIWTTELDTVQTAHNNTSIPHHQRMATLLPHVAGVRQKLLQTLLAEPKARWLGDKETGRINPRALHRLAAPQSDNSDNGRVFRERVRTKRLHTAVTLLVDQSGSMNTTQIKLAGDTALVFCEALSRLDIPCSVVGFSTGDWTYYQHDTETKTGMAFSQLCDSYRIVPLRHIYFKRFHESFRSISGRFDSMQSLNATPLGESILFAARELAVRREERKVLFVLTDGRPGVGLGNDASTFEHAKTSIKRVERVGIDVALVGILEDSVEELHHRSVVVDSLDKLPKIVMQQLQSLLTDHRHTIT